MFLGLCCVQRRVLQLHKTRVRRACRGCLWRHVLTVDRQHDKKTTNIYGLARPVLLPRHKQFKQSKLAKR
jgi:hypothetical protein